MEDTTNNLRWGEGSGMRIASKWQLGVFVECMSRRSGCVDSASEWCLVVICYLERCIRRVGVYC